MNATDFFRQFDDIEPKEIVPGFKARFIHTQGNTIGLWEVKAGCELPMHSHLHEQSSFVLEGTFEMTIGGHTRTLDTGSYALIPPHVPHMGRAITDCRLFDVFSPVREDYLQLK